MEKNCYTAIQTDAVDMFGDSIELVQIDNNLTDNGHTYVNANRNGFIDRWNSEKINKVTKLFGCEIIDNKIMSGTHQDLESAKMSMIQAINAIETYLHWGETVVITTNALNACNENIELFQYNNKITDGSCTFDCAARHTDLKQWDPKKINAIAELYNCELNDLELSKKLDDDFEKAKIAMIQAITAIETYLYLVPEDEADNEEKDDTSMVKKLREEKGDLDEKIMKLKIFLDDDEKLSNIGKEQVRLLRCQLETMGKYSDILWARIDDLEG